MKKIFLVAVFLAVGCSYSPTYRVVRDSYNTYASTNTYSPTYSHTETYAQPNKVKKVKKIKKVRIVPNQYGSTQ